MPINLTAIEVQERLFTQGGVKPPEFTSLDALFKMRIETAKADWIEAGKDEGELAPHFMIITAKGVYTVECPWVDNKEKQSMCGMVREFMHVHKAEFFVFACETWVKISDKDEPPHDLSQDPEAKDALMVLGVHRDGREPLYKSWTRTPDATAENGFRIEEMPGANHLSGALADMLKDSATRPRGMRMLKVDADGVREFKGDGKPQEPDAYMHALSGEQQPSEKEFNDLAETVTSIFDTMIARFDKIQPNDAHGLDADNISEMRDRLNILRKLAQAAVEARDHQMLKQYATSLKTAYDKTMAEIEIRKREKEAEGSTGTP